MSVKKDPAFLFYSKDWIEGTAEMLPEEKGVYIDLLCHQHQKGSLPTDIKRLAKLVGLGEQEFLFIWGGIKDKFFEQDHRLFNRKLTDVMTERSEKGEKNKIIGTLASVYRLSKAPEHIKKLAKQGFSYQTFIGFANQTLTDAVTEWFNNRLKSIENGNANASNNGGSIGNTDTGEPEKKIQVAQPEQLSSKMLMAFRSVNPKAKSFGVLSDQWYCGQIALHIADCNQWPTESVTNGKADLVLAEFIKTMQFTKTDKYFFSKTLKDLSDPNEWSRLYQKANFTTNETHSRSSTTKSTTSKNAGAIELLNNLQSDLGINP
jgi:uncharacterized protein YdaU (DUF1376 family)